MSREPHPGRPNVPTRALCIAIPHDRGDESFADDLNMGRGIVSGRVALLLRSTEIPPHRPNDLLPSNSHIPGSITSFSTPLQAFQHLVFSKHITPRDKDSRRSGLGLPKLWASNQSGLRTEQAGPRSEQSGLRTEQSGLRTEQSGLRSGQQGVSNRD